MKRHEIVSRGLSGNVLVSSAEEEAIYREVSYHLGNLQRELTSQTLYEDIISNKEDTHFVFDIEKGRILAQMGFRNVNYSGVIWGKSGMKMMFMLPGGRRASLPTPFMVFQNLSFNYQIVGVLHIIFGVRYPTKNKGWMDRHVFLESVKNGLAIETFLKKKRRIF